MTLHQDHKYAGGPHTPPAHTQRLRLKARPRKLATAERAVRLDGYSLQPVNAVEALGNIKTPNKAAE
jgi:hypothetical protein